MSLTHVAETAIRRTNQVYFEQVASRETIDLGYAYTNAAHPDLADCNFLGEVLLDGDRATAFERVERWFEQRGSVCQRWIPCAEQDPDEVEAVVTEHGFVRRELRLFAYEALDSPKPPAVLRILSGRAMRRAYNALVSARGEEAGTDGAAHADLHRDRLDDPQYEPFIAFADGQPVGFAGLLQSGPIGRLCDLWITPTARRSGFGSGLTRYAVRTAIRWALRPICAAVRTDGQGVYRRILAGRDARPTGGVGHASVPAFRQDPPGHPGQAAGALLSATGFAECGTMVCFERPGAAVIGG